jgi:hypothetical protein
MRGAERSAVPPFSSDSGSINLSGSRAYISMAEAEIIVPKTGRDGHTARIASMQELCSVLELLNAPDDLLGIVGYFGRYYR